MNYFHIFGKRREGKPSRQSASQSDHGGGRGVGGERGEARVGTLFQIISIVGVYSVQLHAELCKSANFRRSVVLLLQNEGERPETKKGTKNIQSPKPLPTYRVALNHW